MHYRREIDGLRAVAVVPVILFHAGIGIFSGGYVGVDIFFVISGYLITGIIIRELSQNKFSIVRFYERRVRRILPALFFVIICCLPLAWAWMLPGQYKQFSQSLIAVILFVSNMLFWRQSDYFAPAAEEKPLLHTWSLAVEEQYYMLFPLFLILMWRYGRNPVFVSIVAIAAVSLLISEWGWRHKPTANFYFAATRVWELLFGSICALIQFGKPQQRSNLLSLLGLALIAFSLVHYDDSIPFPSLYALAPVIGTSLIILYGAEGTLTARLLSQRLFVGIGLISYSAYLWHQPLFAFARIRSPDVPEKWLMYLLAAMSIFLAYLTWRFVEQPFRGKPARLLPTRRAVFGVSGLLATVIVGYGLYGHMDDGIRQRFSFTDIQEQYFSTALPSPRRDKCHTGGTDYLPPASGCEYFGKDVKIAVFGDSHTVELSYAIARLVEPRDIGIKHLSFSACPPVYEEAPFTTPCAGWTYAALEFLANNDAIRDVVISYRINGVLFGGHEGVWPGQPDAGNPQSRATTLEALGKIAEFLLRADKNVVFVLQSPELRGEMNKLIFFHERSSEPIMGNHRKWWDERSSLINAYLTSIPEKVIVIDPASIFCDEEYCYAGRNGTSYYFDDDHVSKEGAAMIAQRIAPYLSTLKVSSSGQDIWKERRP